VARATSTVASVLQSSTTMMWSIRGGSPETTRPMWRETLNAGMTTPTQGRGCRFHDWVSRTTEPPTVD
jgi:hypothetical protein